MIEYSNNTLEKVGDNGLISEKIQNSYKGIEKSNGGSSVLKENMGKQEDNIKEVLLENSGKKIGGGENNPKKPIKLSKEMINNLPKKKDLYKNKFQKLSDSDFNFLFSGKENVSQGSLGNCYFIAAIQALSWTPFFDVLMQTSIEKKNYGFNLIMPLGEPGGIKIPITQVELKLARLKGSLGYKILEIGFSKYILDKTGKDQKITEQDMKRVEGGRSGFALQTLLGAKSFEGYSITSRGKTNYNPQPHPAGAKSVNNSLDSLKNKDGIINLLKAYDIKKGQGLLSLSSLPGASHDNYYKIGNHTFYQRHAYAISGVSKDSNGNISKVHVQNPWNNINIPGGAKLSLDLDVFLRAFSAMHVGKFTGNFLNFTTSPDEITITDNPGRK